MTKQGKVQVVVWPHVNDEHEIYRFKRETGDKLLGERSRQKYRETIPVGEQKGIVFKCKICSTRKE